MTRSAAPARPAPTDPRTPATVVLGPAAGETGERERRADATLESGTRVGHFEIIGPIGAGGMGMVYAARDRELDRRVAIKLLADDRQRTREGNLRLLREAQAMARLSHPNVVSIYEVGELDHRTVFLAMEYVDGLRLDEWRRAAPRTWRSVRDALVQAGRGLAAAHKAGLVHRDFKPSNVLVDREGRARVTDFGIARLDGDDVDGEDGDDKAVAATPLAIALTRTGAAVGTPAYMAPEQHRGEPVTAAADQFAFCVTAWEAFHGARPFSGSSADLAAAIERGDVGPPATDRDVPSWITDLLRRGLAAQPGGRWPSLAALLDRLDDDPEVRRRRRWIAVAALAVVGSGAAATTWMLAPGERSSSDPLAVCRVGGHDLDATWTAERRVAIERVFAATGSPVAGDNWRLVEGAVDRWTGAWGDAWRGACADHVRHQQSDDLHDRRMICLQRHRTRFETLVDLLGKADAALVRESPMVAAALPFATECEDTKALLSQRPPPVDPAVRALVDVLHGHGDRANTLRTAGHFKEAFAIVSAGVEQAKGVDYAPVQAELAFSMGLLCGDLGDRKASEEWLHKAADLAATAQAPALYARTYVQLVWEVGFTQQRYDDAAPLRTVAQQAVHLAGDPPMVVGLFEMHAAAVDYAHGDFEEAAAEIERSIVAFETLGGPQSVYLVAPLNLRASIVGALDREGESARSWQRALEILQRVSPRHPRVGSLLDSLGGVAHRAGRFEESIDLHRRAVAIGEAAYGAGSPQMATPLNNLAQPLWALDRFDEASALLQRALDGWKAGLGAEHPYVAVALANIGGLRCEQRRYAEALPYLEQALAIQDKKLSADNPSTAMTLTFLGGCLVDLGRPADALPRLERALAIQGKRGGATDRAAANFEIARARWALGRDRAGALALAEEARQAYAADPGDQAQRAAGVTSSAEHIAAWMQGKR